MTEAPTAKALSTSSVSSVPHHYICHNLDTSADTAEIPIIDFSLLCHGTFDQRSQAVKDLAHACQHWGFFIVVNHGIPERVVSGVFEKGREFFELPEEDKKMYEGKQPLDPVRCGTSFNTAVEDVRYWRDFLKLFFVYPNLVCPRQPKAFRETLLEYSNYINLVSNELLKAINKSLGLENNYMEQELSTDTGLNHLALNLYPPCPQPELALGMPPHSDHGLITLLMQDDISGLQVLRDGKWIAVKPIPNSLLVNTGDHLEIFSNGKYKSVIHRVVLNNRSTRMSVAFVRGPSMEKTVAPAAQLVREAAGEPALYWGVNYMEFLKIQQGSKLEEKSVLEALKIGH